MAFVVHFSPFDGRRMSAPNPEKKNLQTKIKYENKQRAITQKLSKEELWFLCTALHLDEIYPPMKFHNCS